MSVNYNPGTGSADSIVTNALTVASAGATEINSVIQDLGNGNTLDGAGLTTLKAYDGSGMSAPNISDASGAMIIDDLMQKISTKVQVAAQLLSTANTINKTVSRTMAQG